MHLLVFFRGLMYSSNGLLLSKASFSQYQNSVRVSEEPDF